MTRRPTFCVKFAGIERELPLFEAAPGVRIAIFNMLGDVEAVEAAADALLPEIPADAEALVTAEAKSIPLVHALAARAGRTYVVLRKTRKPYMGDALHVVTHSITTGMEQTLYLDEKDRSRIAGRPVALVDDVVSTGSTLEAMRRLMGSVDARVVKELAVFTEGDDAGAFPAIARLGHLPLFRDRTT